MAVSLSGDWRSLTSIEAIGPLEKIDIAGDAAQAVEHLLLALASHLLAIQNRLQALGRLPDRATVVELQSRETGVDDARTVASSGAAEDADGNHV